MYNKENLTRIAKPNQLAPELMKAFLAFDKAAVAEGAMAVSVHEISGLYPGTSPPLNAQIVCALRKEK